VLVATRGGPFTGVSAATLRRRAEKMLLHLRLSGVELSVALVGDATIRELNRAYRRKDKATDVLAFALEEGGARGGDRTQRGSSPSGLLGDVILSVDTARRQARQRRRPLLDELTLLLAHGLLHLMGFDHRTDAEEREMTALTRELTAAAQRRRKARTAAAGIQSRRPV
jgi:probable rRNA maturation factor